MGGRELSLCQVVTRIGVSKVRPAGQLRPPETLYLPFQQHCACFWPGSGRERQEEALEGSEYYGGGKTEECDAVKVLGEPSCHVSVLSAAQLQLSNQLSTSLLLGCELQQKCCG